MKLRHFAYTLPLAAILASCGDSKKEKETGSTAAITVSIAKAGIIADNNLLQVSGQLVANQSAAISTRIMGYITQMPVKIGDNVKAGQLLFAVKSTDIQAKDGQVAASIAQAEAALVNAKKDYDRFVILRQQNSATDKELENVTLQYRAAQAQVQAAHQMRNEVNANLAYANVTAPFSGTITQKMMEAGSMASPGMPVLMLESSGTLQANILLTDEQVALVHKGLEVTVLATPNDASKNNITVQGKIAEISQSSVGTGGQYLAKIDLRSHEGLLSGMYVHVEIPVNGKNITTAGPVRIPVQSLVKQGDLTGVYTIAAGNKALLRWLRTGAVNNGQVEVLAGLSNGETYISDSDSRLYNGATVKY